jgi:hypothetical protein
MGIEKTAYPKSEEYDPIWDDICTAMAWITEEIAD